MTLQEQFTTSASGPMVQPPPGPCDLGMVWPYEEPSTNARIQHEPVLSAPNAQTTSGMPIENALPSTGAAIMELRRISGLTWEQLAKLFGVSRRSLHFWASGKPLTTDNEERLQRLLAAVRKIDTGDAAANRSLLFTSLNDGQILYDLLLSGHFREADLRSVECKNHHRPALTPISASALASRRPARPEELLGAKQDTIHRDIGKSRSASAFRPKKKR